VFQVFDYLSRWLQQKNGMMAAYASRNSRAMHIPPSFDPLKEKLQISRVEQILVAIPPRVIAIRAEECKSFSRAVFHYEEDMRQIDIADVDTQLKQLQAVYEQINEPDAIEGISARLRTIDLSQQVLDHKRSGRWAAALSYYEIAVQEKPDDVKTHIDLLSCLKASSQYDSLLNAVQSHTEQTPEYYSAVVPFAAEAAWVTGRYEILERLMSHDGASTSQDFNAGLAKALLALRNDDLKTFNFEISELRGSVSRSFSPSATLSLSTAHSHLLKLHVLYELDMLSGFRHDSVTAKDIMRSLDRRLDMIGSFTEDKQYVLGVRRAVIELSQYESLTMQHIGSLWLTSSRLSRKANQIDPAHDAVLRAASLEEPAAKIEHARLLWKGGHSRKAIQSLQAALLDGTLLKQNFSLTSNSVTKSTGVAKGPQNLLMAKGQLLLAKWMDLGGQEKSITVLERYKEVSKLNSASDKGHYFLGSYYNKILDSEKAAPENMQSSNYLSGECTKLVIDNYLRSMFFGPKYLYRTVPKVLTLWLDLGQEIAESKKKTQSGRKSDRKRDDMDESWLKAKMKSMDKINDQVKKYLVTRLPAYVPYTSFAQILSRINNPHKETSALLTEVIERIVTQYPRQALWSLYAVSRSGVEEKKKIARDLLRRLVVSYLHSLCDIYTKIESSKTRSSRRWQALLYPVKFSLIACLTFVNDLLKLEAFSLFQKISSLGEHWMNNLV
jgi:serine/threonine-protein kinase ATR